jgi:ABC-2 type transport system permease protein
LETIQKPAPKNLAEIETASASIVVQNLTKLYSKGKRKSARPETIAANDDISLEIQSQEIFGLLGPNGAGKTTLVNQILGLSRPTHGSIRVEVLDYPEQVRAISAYLPQKSVEFGSIEVRRLLIYTGQIRGLSKLEAETQATKLLADLELEAEANRYISKLSGGMQRMANLAIALMGRPKLLVLDEPTNELDPERRRLVWDFLRSHIREWGSTCLLVTHSILEAASILERVAIMQNGKIIAVGTPGELKQKYTSRVCLELTLKETAATVFRSSLNQKLRETGLQTQVEIAPAEHNPLVLKLYLPPTQSDAILNLVIHKIGLEYLDDWTLSSASLEDVYLNLVGGKNG